LKEEVAAAKRQEQHELQADNEFTYLGNGPKATGGAFGWHMASDLYFKCIRCGYLMGAATNLTDLAQMFDRCFCGAMSKDADAGRFGSDLGDEQIEVYRARPKQQAKG
jgi:hypothetical protein